MYKAVVFDFGNVLCGLDRMAFARAAAPHSTLSAEEIDGAIWGGSLERDFETGMYDSHGYFERVGRLAGFTADYSYEDFVEDYRKNHPAQSGWGGGPHRREGSGRQDPLCFRTPPGSTLA